MPTFIPVATRAEAREAAKQHLKNNPNLTGGNLYELPDGTKIRVRKKESGRLSSENYDTKNQADTKRAKSAKEFRTDEEYKNYQQVQSEARQESNSTLVQYGTDGKRVTLEHDHRLASGGTNETVSKSDPFFAQQKTALENKVNSRFGDAYDVDINEITGYVRVIPKQFYNKEQRRSEQPGIDFEPGMDLDQFVNRLPFTVAQNLGMSNTKFPGAEQQSPIKTTGGRVVYRPPSLPGFMEQERTPQVTPPQSKYVPPVVMQYSHETYTNGKNGTNGDNGHSHSNGSPPKNGGNGGNGNGGLVNGLIDITREYEPEHKDINDLAPLFIGGRVVLQTVGGLVTASP